MLDNSTQKPSVSITTRDAVIMYVLSLAISFLISFILGAIFALPILLSYAIPQVGNLIAVFGYLYSTKRDPVAQFFRNSTTTAKNVGLSVSTSVSLVAQNLLLVFAFTLLMEKLGKTLTVPMPDLTNFGTFLLALFTVCVLPAIGEELLFRGVFVTALKEKGEATAILFSALIFALMHFNLAQLIHQFIVGLVLGYVYVKTKNLIYCMVIHFVNNAVAIVTETFFPALNNLATLSAVSTLILITLTLAGATCLYLSLRTLTKNTPKISPKLTPPDAYAMGLVLVLAVLSTIISIAS